MSHFDEHGDLWIDLINETNATILPEGSQIVRFMKLQDIPSVFGIAATEMNLTRYIRDLIANQTGAVP